MASSAVVYPLPPLPNKRTQGIIGGDLIVTYHSYLGQCDFLPVGSRYTNNGAFTAGTFLPFNQPPFVHELYPRLLSSEDEESSGLPLLLSMFNAGANAATLEEDWEGKWFTIVARLCPNKLTFRGVRLDGYDSEETQSVEVSLALPRDGGLTPIAPRLLCGDDESAPWPSSPAHASFAGPVDLETFRIKDDAWSKTLIKTSVFVKLGSYLLPENDRPPHKGVHICHVLLIFPIEQQPWSSLHAWMHQAANPFPKGSWVVCSGRILGVLNRELVQGPRIIDSTVRILVILPDDLEFVRQNALSTNSASTPISSNIANGSPTSSRAVGPGHVVSRNPFPSPSHGRKASTQRNATVPTVPPKQPDHEVGQPPTSLGEGAPMNADTAGVDPTITIPSSESDGMESSSDTEKLLEDQPATISTTPTPKRKEPGSPEPTRRKRATAGKKKARLYD